MWRRARFQECGGIVFRLSLSARIAFAQLAQMIVFFAAIIFILGSTSRLFDKTAFLSERLEPAVEKLNRIEEQLSTAITLLESSRHEDLRRADRMLVRNRPVRQIRTLATQEFPALAASPDLDHESATRLAAAANFFKTAPSPGTAAAIDSEIEIDGLRIKMTAAMQDPQNGKAAAVDLATRLQAIRTSVQNASRQTGQVIADARHELVSRRSTLWTSILAVSIGSLLLSIVFLVTAIRSTRPIGDITLAVRKLAAGDLSHVRIRASRELEETAEAINHLASTFRAQREAGAVEREREVRTERLAVVGRMASAVAHEIRNPLNSISLNIDLLADILESPERREGRGREVISTVQREIDRLNEITEDYLQFGRMPKAVIGPCNVTAVVKETCDFMAGEFQEGHITVHIDSFDNGARVMSDEGQLRQALVNILRNSVEAMPEGGSISIRLSGAGDCVELAISDTGQGIPDAQMARLFEPFATTKRNGTGLGLAFVQQVITESGGKVRIESQEANGTTVRITLARAA